MTQTKTPGTRSATSREASGGLVDAALIRDLADILKETDLSEIEIERKDFRIRVAREIHVSTHVAVPPPAHPGPAATALPSLAISPAVKPTPSEGTVTSPMVGTVYLSPAPDKPAFVAVGAKVRRGQTLLIIEAMKTFNEIPAPRDGTVTAILVEAGHPVEYGEALLVLE